MKVLIDVRMAGVGLRFSLSRGMTTDLVRVLCRVAALCENGL